MCGIFAYLNYLTPKTRKEIIDLLIGGLKRLEYRGYDSAGVYVILPYMEVILRISILSTYLTQTDFWSNSSIFWG